MTLTAKGLVKAINNAFPNIHDVKVVDDEKVFLGDVAEGGEINDLPACDYYNEDYKEVIYIMGVHKELYKLVYDAGWFVEPYDPGTYHAYMA